MSSSKDFSMKALRTNKSNDETPEDQKIMVIALPFAPAPAPAPAPSSAHVDATATATATSLPPKDNKFLQAPIRLEHADDDNNLSDLIPAEEETTRPGAVGVYPNRNNTDE